MSRGLILALLFSTLGTPGCYAVRYSQGDLDRVDRQQAVVHKTWSHNLVWGLASANEVDLDDLCGPSGAAELKSSYGPFGLFGQVVTLGFWTPIRVKVTCHPGPVQPQRPAIAMAPEPPPLAVPATRPQPQSGDRVVVIPSDGGRTVIIVE